MPGRGLGSWSPVGIVSGAYVADVPIRAKVSGTCGIAGIQTVTVGMPNLYDYACGRRTVGIQNFECEYHGQAEFALGNILTVIAQTEQTRPQ